MTSIIKNIISKGAKKYLKNYDYLEYDVYITEVNTIKGGNKYTYNKETYFNYKLV